MKGVPVMTDEQRRIPHVNDDDVEKETEPPVVVAEDAWLSWRDEVQNILDLFPAVPTMETTAIKTSLQTLQYWLNHKEVVP